MLETLIVGFIILALIAWGLNPASGNRRHGGRRRNRGRCRCRRL